MVSKLSVFAWFPKIGYRLWGSPIAIHGFCKKRQGRGKEKERERKMIGKRKRRRRGKEMKRKRKGMEKEKKRKGRGKRGKRKGVKAEEGEKRKEKKRIYFWPALGLFFDKWVSLRYR